MSSYNRPMASSSGNIRKSTYDLYVAGFPPTVNDEVLKESFLKFGPIAEVQIKESTRSDQSRYQFAFVQFLCQESVDLALADPVYIGGSRLRCGPATRSFGSRGGSENVNDAGGSTGGYSARGNQVAVASGNKPDIVSFSHSNGHSGLTQHDNQNGPSSQAKKHVQLFMTHVESPCVFWAQKPELAEVIANVERSLASVCPNACPLTTKPEPEKMYGTQFSFDQQWYRCELHRYVSESQSEVIYSDYGNKEIVDDDKIVVLPECLMQLHPLASKYSLYGIEAVNDPVLFAKGLEKLSLLKEKSVMNAILCEPLNGIAQVKMRTTEGYDVNRVMLNSKTCVAVCDLDASQSCSKEHLPEVSGVPKIRKIRDGSGDRDGPGMVSRLEKEVRELQNVVEVLEREAENQKQAFEIRLAVAIINNKCSNKLARVFSGLQTVMLLRAQSDTAASVSDPIEDAITMATESSIDTSLDKVPVLGQIDAVRSRYQALQLKLRSATEDAQCQNSNANEMMITDRNEVRSELFKLLHEFIVLFSDVDALTSLETQIEKLLSTLEVRYASYLAMPTVSDVNLDSSSSEAYLAWKDEKQQKSEDTRKTTDSLGLLVMECFMKLHEELRRRSSAVDLTEISTPNLDRLVDDYENAIDGEIKRAKQGESANDVAIIQRTLISLTSELRRKLESVRQLIKLRARFIDECDDLKQWLNKSPNLSKLQTTAKTIKALKSKLRYRLVDMQDMQEDGRESSEEFLSVENDLEEIRGQLQKQLEIEDEQLKWLSVLTLNHFPEMIVQHPELNLQKFIKFGGLLKSGYMLDQFKLKPLPGCAKKYVYKSTFCGKPVILKEFLVGIQSDASETNFLKSVMKYSELMSPHLAQLVAVFFGMNDRQAVIVSPCYESNLTQLMEDIVLWHKPDMVKVLGSVLRGLSALHGMELVHGAIHPNNVLISKSAGIVVVADYDFTKTPIQRCEDPFITSSGLVFQAPELQLGAASCQPTYLSDMYNFGLLILWIHDPEVASVPSNLPEKSSKLLDCDTARLVTFLLDSQPERRPATDQILEVGYFNPDEPNEESFVTNATEEASLANETDGANSSVGVLDAETEAQLMDRIVKDATEECEAEKVEERGLPESVGEEPETKLEENNICTAYDSKQDAHPAECAKCELEDVVSDDSCRNV